MRSKVQRQLDVSNGMGCLTLSTVAGASQVNVLNLLKAICQPV